MARVNLRVVPWHLTLGGSTAAVAVLVVQRDPALSLALANPPVLSTVQWNSKLFLQLKMTTCDCECLCKSEFR